MESKHCMLHEGLHGAREYLPLSQSAHIPRERMVTGEGHLGGRKWVSKSRSWDHSNGRADWHTALWTPEQCRGSQLWNQSQPSTQQGSLSCYPSLPLIQKASLVGLVWEEHHVLDSSKAITVAALLGKLNDDKREKEIFRELYTWEVSLSRITMSRVDEFLWKEKKSSNSSIF